MSSASASALPLDESSSFDQAEPKIHAKARKGLPDFCVATALAAWVAAVVLAAGVIRW